MPRAALATHQADVVIAGTSADECALLAFAAWLANSCEQIRGIVVVETRAQRERCLAAGAHATLQKGRLNDALLRVTVEDGG